MIHPYVIEKVQLKNRVRYRVRNYWFRSFMQAYTFLSILNQK